MSESCSAAQACKPAIGLAPYISSLIAALLSGIVLCSPATAATLQVLHEFSGPDGSDPTGGLVIDEGTGTLYGTTIFGGTGDGTVFSLTPPAPGTQKWKFKTIYTFKGGDDGSRPESGLDLIFSSDLHPMLFGTTRDGSIHCGGCGTVFLLTPSSDPRSEWTKTTIHDFSGDALDGTVPSSAPFIDPQGSYLYGTTGSIGGSGGTIYRLSLNNYSHFRVVYNPGQSIGTFVGYHPQGVVVDGGGAIFGTAFDGTDSGTIFRMDSEGNGSVLHGFNGPDGAHPQAPPILAQDGTLYGTTVQGGNPNDCPNSPGCGTVWKRAPGGRFRMLHSFRFFKRPHDGMSPISPLALDVQTGTVYGTTYYGGTGTSCGGVSQSCGTIFAMDVDGNAQTIWNFPRGGPANPQGKLVFYDSEGALYGTSYDGGKACPDQHYIGCGTVWKLTP